MFKNTINQLVNTAASLSEYAVVRFLGAAAVYALTASLADAAIANAGGYTFVQAVNNMSDGVQAVGVGATSIGATCAFISLARSHGNFSEIGHGAMGVVTIGGLVLGVPALITTIPHVQAALL